jgi:hypothetical protein
MYIYIYIIHHIYYIYIYIYKRIYLAPPPACLYTYTSVPPLYAPRAYVSIRQHTSAYASSPALAQEHDKDDEEEVRRVRPRRVAVGPRCSRALPQVSATYPQLLRCQHLYFCTSQHLYFCKKLLSEPDRPPIAAKTCCRSCGESMVN